MSENGNGAKAAASRLLVNVVGGLAIVAILGAVRHEVILHQLLTDREDRVTEADLLKSEQRIKDAFPPAWLRQDIAEIKEDLKQQRDLLLQLAGERRNGGDGR